MHTTYWIIILPWTICSEVTSGTADEQRMLRFLKPHSSEKVNLVHDPGSHRAACRAFLTHRERFWPLHLHS